MVRWKAKLFGAISLSLSLGSCASTQLVGDEQAACSVATTRVTAERRLSADHVAFCDHARSPDVPPGYYVLALRGHCRQPEGCGSTNMGWFAVHKQNGQVFEWDVAESKLRQRVRAGF
jgi:hypothetical protein